MESKTFTITLSGKALEALDEITANSEFADLDIGRNKMIAYVLASYKKMQSELVEQKKKYDELVLNALKAGNGKTTKAPPLSYAEKKEQEEARQREKALGFAAQLAGRVEGDICFFKKYEITAAGFVVDMSVSENIFNLSEKTVADQYYPNRAEWEKAKKIEDAKG